MTTNREVYEGKILETLIKNSERLAVVEQKLIILAQKLINLDRKYEAKFDKLEKDLSGIKKLGITILIGVIINIFSQPVISWLF